MSGGIVRCVVLAAAGSRPPNIALFETNSWLRRAPHAGAGAASERCTGGWGMKCQAPRPARARGSDGTAFPEICWLFCFTVKSLAQLARTVVARQISSVNMGILMEGPIVSSRGAVRHTTAKNLILLLPRLSHQSPILPIEPPSEQDAGPSKISCSSGSVDSHARNLPDADPRSHGNGSLDTLATHRGRS